MNRRNFYKTLCGAFVAVALDMGAVQSTKFEIAMALKELVEWVITQRMNLIRTALDENMNITKGLDNWIQINQK